ncbi:phosphatidylglycerophosphatase [Stappia sp.]|uniref:phosphatidylglycerophosphatase n=1 Tax=Stappia sp. TaxID=1870903 RepID=UPI003A9A3DE1
MTPAESLSLLFGLAGLLNPFALLIGAALGWYADARAKLIIAAFAAAALSVLIDASLNLSGVRPIGGYDGGPLAVLPFRFVGALLIAMFVYGIRKRTRRKRK